ncbi:MAG TPA: hypothetical protein DCM05_07015 [Elusimicrobia bacterium]|nr:MAG: hypothetical protein A3J79_00610 [Elusimicrobia bacterium RIFOXYB2_FULL_62_6]HAH06266.1 hypothetical protein [Elusimicrobiota bacterium]
MKPKNRIKGLLRRKLEDPGYRERFERSYAAFTLEVQILNALEEKGWSYSDLAKALHTRKSNISRDISAGRINRATVFRLAKIGEALGLLFLPLFIPKAREQVVLAGLHRLVAAKAA